jgi:archaellum component FlaC
MDRRLEKIDEKLDKLDEKLNSVDVTLAKQAQQLEHHIYRTDLAEEHLRKLESELKPIKIHVERLNGVLKFIGILSTFAGIGKLILELYKL